MFKDSFFKKIEDKTSVNKETIMSLANKLQANNLKDEQTIREIIQELCQMTGKNITKEKEDKIINAILNDKVPKNIEKML